MKRLLTNRTVGITELREPAKIFDKAADRPVAILKNNECVGYIVPVAAVDDTEPRFASPSEVAAILETSNRMAQPVLDYLKDK
ncbi:hypothetical protein F9L33_09650 [Amylibacter sp. SFDW26]|uniref:hypothetical protein n=1 Tax=Amylibacter sp. SFDW26 TaxID=2652722 RepID=UPI0012613C89|nr:hypothetical protein [Amylibacter sp. SFDW26]KAB7613633.1 hypothetical protein F9L33_09650 [Amylibacter sp. SFDW26]